MLCNWVHQSSTTLARRTRSYKQNKRGRRYKAQGQDAHVHAGSAEIAGLSAIRRKIRLKNVYISSPNSPFHWTKDESRGMKRKKQFKDRRKKLFLSKIRDYGAQTRVRISVKLLANSGCGCTTLTVTRQAPNTAVLEATCLFFFNRNFRSFCAWLAL